VVLAGNDSKLHRASAVHIDNGEVLQVVKALLVSREVVGWVSAPHLVDAEELTSRRQGREVLFE
jgi:hypothetical protein